MELHGSGVSGALSPKEASIRNSNANRVSDGDFKDIFKLVSSAVDHVEGHNGLSDTAKSHFGGDAKKDIGQAWNLF